MEKSYEFKGASVEQAKKRGLAELGVEEEDVTVEVVSKGGIFAKATVKITVKEKEETEAEEEELPPTYEELARKGEMFKNYDDYKTFASERGIDEEEQEEKKPQRRERVREEEPDELYEVKKEMLEKGLVFVETTAKMMGLNVTVEGKVRREEVCIYVAGDDAKGVIGRKGETLEALQSLTSAYLNKDREERIRVIVDADFYRERRKKTLTALAKKLAKQAFDQHKEIALEPMNSYERRILHAALANSNEATTRSDGEGKDRHVVIVPKNGVMSYGNTSSQFRKKGPSKTKSYGYNKRKF